MSNEILGQSIIGSGRGSAKVETFRAFDPRTGNEVEPVFYSASMDDLENAVRLAAESRIVYGKTSGKAKAEFLRRIATNIEALGNTLVERIELETALLPARIESERGRTCFQLRMFADLVEEGSWVDARIDHALPERTSIPKPDIRSMLRPLGPVAVFCASNFPLAYSVAGGDTASALAAGCPVIVIAHTAHPGTAELVGTAVQDAAKTCGMPEGVFSLLFAKNYDIGQALAAHTDIKAVGFTGSRTGGKALMKIAAARPEPIPVYAEMSSVNPVFILPKAIAERGETIAEGLYNSFTLGAGQFCTKPGIVLLDSSTDSRAFGEKLESLAENFTPIPLLTGGIQKSYFEGTTSRAVALDTNAAANKPEGFGVGANVFRTSVDRLLSDDELSSEIFGPTTLLVNAKNRDELLHAANDLEGQLTASVFGTDEELAEYADLIAILETKAGRLIFNGFPTGVEVCSSIVHGGPFPATSDSRSTSVGSRAIERFCRLVCYQGFPENGLPDELKESNPLSIQRMIDGDKKFCGVG